MSFSLVVKSHLFKGVATLSSFVFVAVVLINPDLYSQEDQYSVSAQFLANDYSNQDYIVDSSLSDLQDIQKEETSENNKPKKSLQVHVVKAGDTLSQIASTYNISSKKIQEINNIQDPSKLKLGSPLYLTDKKGVIHVLKETTSLMVFADLYSLEKEDLMVANGQENDMYPYNAGEAIIIPNKDINRLYNNSLKRKPELKKIVKKTPKKKGVPVKYKKPVKSHAGSYSSSKDVIHKRWRENTNEYYGFYKGYCTDYAAAKADFAFGKNPDGSMRKGRAGDARFWKRNAERAGFKTSITPTPGAIGVLSDGGGGNPAGHVLIVESVDRKNKTILVSDMNYKGGRGSVTLRTIAMNDAMTTSASGKQKFIGFIPVQERPKK